ncbi:MAG: right-handed parallel beta-helix repeat-containing protein, partial [Thermoplasmata archaeon]
FNNRAPVFPFRTCGIYPYQSSNNIISENNITNNDFGMWVDRSPDNTISRNNITYNSVGIYLYFTSNRNIVDHNNISKNAIGIDVVPGNADGENKISHNNIFSNSNIGLQFRDSRLNIISHNNIYSNNNNGLIIDKGYSITISYNNIYSNGNIGIHLKSTSINTVDNNNILSNTGHGIYIESSSSNDLFDNVINSNLKYGIYLKSSSKNDILRNDISSNSGNGTYLRASNRNNIIYNNITSNSYYGIYINNSHNNTIHHNNIAYNNGSTEIYSPDHIQAYDDLNLSFWNNTYPSGGNYWLDYDGVDLNCTPSQDVPPSDGIGDTPYVYILGGAGVQDHYPLMNPHVNLYLYPGWNLISLPYIPYDTELSTLLEPIKGSYDAVQWFNATDTDDHWKHNQVSKALNLNDLNDINHMICFWIHITKANGIMFEYRGMAPIENQTITLYSGWNMVGYPSLTCYTRTEGLNDLTFGQEVDLIQWYDAQTQTWHDMGENDYFVPGRGYWIHSKVETTWDVPM